MDLCHSMADRKPIVSDFLQKLADSGYSHPTRMEIVKSAARKFYRQLMDQEAGGSRLYRSSEEMAKSRKLKELVNKTWYKSKRGRQRIISGKDVPRTSTDQEVAARKSTRAGNAAGVRQEKSREQKEEMAEGPPIKMEEV